MKMEKYLRSNVNCGEEASSSRSEERERAIAHMYDGKQAKLFTPIAYIRRGKVFIRMRIFGEVDDVVNRYRKG